MLISCLLVSHSKPMLCEEMIQSVICQSHTDWELLIMDSGVLYDQGYFDRYRNDGRISVVRSEETQQIRDSVAIAPWCYNKMLPKMCSGELVIYASDDDCYFPHAFAIFNEYMRRNPDWLACYSSQDHGHYAPPEKSVVTGTRHAHIIRGRGISRSDCQVDGGQLCHRRKLFDIFPMDDFWPEDRRHKHHSDGLLLEKIGTRVMIHPVPFKTSFNRRTPQSDNMPLRRI